MEGLRFIAKGNPIASSLALRPLLLSHPVWYILAWCVGQLMQWRVHSCQVLPGWLPATPASVLSSAVSCGRGHLEQGGVEKESSSFGTEFPRAAQIPAQEGQCM